VTNLGKVVPGYAKKGLEQGAPMVQNTVSVKRRAFLKFMGRGALTSAALSGAPGCAHLLNPKKVEPKGLSASTKDEFVVAKGLTFNVVASWEDPINRTDSFGFNNDFVAHVKFGTDTFLWVNHEYTDPGFVSQRSIESAPTLEQFKSEAQSVGGSFIRVSHKNGQWKLESDPRNFRLSGLSKIPFAWPSPIQGSNFAIGTVANCGGGVTPWGTVLTCEENYDDCYGEAEADTNGRRVLTTKSKFQWNKVVDHPPEHYGWVVEIEPVRKTAKKLVALGRFAHENACVVTGQDGRCVVYMGDDTEDEFIYKFVADRPGTLESGELFVADTKQGKWLSLDWAKQTALQKVFKNQTEVLVYARRAGRVLGATPQNRPEDLEFDIRSGAVFIALTNNKNKGDEVGRIAKLEELDGINGQRFQMTTYLAGGPELGFACPDNMAFDPQGNLWFTTDMPEKGIEKGALKGLGNNALYFVPMAGSGPRTGAPIRVAVGPKDSELTGPCFSPDGRTLFLCVQHPGGNWPGGGDSTPRPSVVALQGPLLDQFSRVGAKLN